MDNKVKVRYYVTKNHYKIIEVNESAVEIVNKLNDLLWKELNSESYKKIALLNKGITMCSYDASPGLCDVIKDEDYINPEEKLVLEEDMSEKKMLIAKCMKKLRKLERKIIVLRFYEEMSFAEISLELGIPKTTVFRYFNTIEEKFGQVLAKTGKKNGTKGQKIHLY